MDECDLIVLISAIACTLSKCCTTEELSLLAVTFTQLGDTLSTVITKRELNEKQMNNDKTNGCSNIVADNDNKEDK